MNWCYRADKLTGEMWWKLIRGLMLLEKMECVVTGSFETTTPKQSLPKLQGTHIFLLVAHLFWLNLWDLFDRPPLCVTSHLDILYALFSRNKKLLVTSFGLQNLIKNNICQCSTWVIMNRETRRLSKIPEEVRKEVQPFYLNRVSIPKEDADSEKIEKLTDETAKRVRSGLAVIIIPTFGHRFNPLLLLHSLKLISSS